MFNSLIMLKKFASKQIIYNTQKRSSINLLLCKIMVSVLGQIIIIKEGLIVVALKA